MTHHYPLKVDLCPVRCPDPIKDLLEEADNFVIIADLDDRITIKTTFPEDTASQDVNKLLWKTILLLVSNAKEDD